MMYSMKDNSSPSAAQAAVVFRLFGGLADTVVAGFVSLISGFTSSSHTDAEIYYFFVFVMIIHDQKLNVVDKN